MLLAARARVVGVPQHAAPWRVHTLGHGAPARIEADGDKHRG